MNIEPIKYPKWWLEISSKQHFFAGVPFWGANAKLARDVKNKLIMRNNIVSYDLWGKDTLTINLVQRINIMINKFYGLPENIIYIPNDQLSLIFHIAFNEDDIGLFMYIIDYCELTEQLEYLLIEKYFNAKINTFIEYGEFIKEIVEHLKENKIHAKILDININDLKIPFFYDTID